MLWWWWWWVRLFQPLSKTVRLIFGKSDVVVGYAAGLLGTEYLWWGGFVLLCVQDIATSATFLSLACVGLEAACIHRRPTIIFVCPYADN